MPVPMSKEEIEYTIQLMRERNNSVPAAHYDRVIERMCNYIDANLDDFMECYEGCEDDEQPYDIYLTKDKGHCCELLDTDSLSDIMGGGQG